VSCAEADEAGFQNIIWVRPAVGLGNRTFRATSRLVELYPIHEAFDVMEVLVRQDIGELCEGLRAVALGDRTGQARSLSEEESSQACVLFRRHPAATAWCPVRALPGCPRRANLGTGRKGFRWREGLTLRLSGGRKPKAEGHPPAGAG